MGYLEKLADLRISALNVITNYIKEHGDLKTEDYHVFMNPGLKVPAIYPIPYEIGKTKLLKDIDSMTLCHLADIVKKK